jgi:bifunctional non-homologous end joining protein LigD
MLAEAQERPFTAPGWLFELKLDGYRAVAARGNPPLLLSRNGNDLSPCFPEVGQALRALPFERLVLDGELVALDDAGRPNFQRLQQRAQLRRSLDIHHAMVECPVTFYAFDLLTFDEFDLRSLPLRSRKALLQQVVPAAGIIRYLEHFEEEGEVLYQQVQKLGLEGVVSPHPRAAGVGLGRCSSAPIVMVSSPTADARAADSAKNSWARSGRVSRGSCSETLLARVPFLRAMQPGG